MNRSEKMGICAAEGNLCIMLSVWHKTLAKNTVQSNDYISYTYIYIFDFD